MKFQITEAESKHFQKFEEYALFFLYFNNKISQQNWNTAVIVLAILAKMPGKIL